MITTAVIPTSRSDSHWRTECCLLPLFSLTTGDDDWSKPLDCSNTSGMGLSPSLVHLSSHTRYLLFLPLSLPVHRHDRRHRGVGCCRPHFFSNRQYGHLARLCPPSGTCARL